jgi:hypothetical protein
VLQLELAIASTSLYYFLVKNIIHDFLAMVLYFFGVAFNYTTNRFIKVYILQSFIFTYDIYFEIMKADQIMRGEGFEWKILVVK